MGLKELCFRIFTLSDHVVSAQTDDSPATNRCSGLNTYVAKELEHTFGDSATTMVNLGLTVGSASGHEIGLARDSSGRIVAFDASIQQFPGHEGRTVKIWRGSPKEIARQLRNDLGGKWNHQDIENALRYK